MTFNIFKDSGQGFYFVFLLITAVVCIAALVLRFVASHVTRRKLGLEDLLAAAAVAVFLARTSAGLRAIVIINGRYWDLADTPSDYEAAFKMVFVADIITMLDQTLSKLSVCALYLRIFAVMKSYRIWIYSLGAAQVLCYCGLLVMQPLQCRPINKFWQFWVDGHCFPFSWILLALEIPNSLIDFALVGLAMVMIKSIQLNRGSMWKLRVLFGLGSFAGIFGFVKIGLSYQKDSPYTTAVIGLWAAIQSTACIICCCAPVCGKLFSEWGLWSGLKYRTRSLNSYLHSIRIGGSSSPVEYRSNKTDKTASIDQRSSSTDSPQKPPVASHHTWLRFEEESTDSLVRDEYHGWGHDQAFPMGSIPVDRSVDVFRTSYPGQIADVRPPAGITRFNG